MQREALLILIGLFSLCSVLIQADHDEWMDLEDRFFNDETELKGTKPKFFNFVFSRPGMKRKSERLIIFNVERYGNWTEWSECLPRYCIEVRHRKCLDDSWEQPKPNRVQTSQCLSKYYAEKRTCSDKSLCNSEIGAQMIKNLSETCGIRPDEVAPKITGGEESIPHSWPWAVRLSVKPPRQRPITFCGGTLIAPNWVLTAAHCLLVENKKIPVGKLINLGDYMRSALYVHLGDHHKNQREESQQDFRVTKAILHPKYHRKLMTDGFDIALLYVAQPIRKVSQVDFACLPPEEFKVKPGDQCYAVGWGNSRPKPEPTFEDLPSSFDSILTPFPGIMDISFGFARPMWPRPIFRSKANEEDISTKTLHEVALPIVSIDQCNRHYADLSESVHICAGTKGKDTCSGDSGGGLYCKNPTSGRWIVAGITSFGLAKGCGRHPGIYTSVNAHMEWTSKIIATPVV